MMGLFGKPAPFEEEIEKATNEGNTTENWSLIIEVCDKIQTQRNAKECLRAIMKRLNNTDPHVVMQAITLLDACSNNCGEMFRLEIASREFEKEYRNVLARAQPKIAAKLRQVLKNWAEGDYKTDSQLNLIPQLYNSLRREGMDFSNLGDSPPKPMNEKLVALAKDPNFVSSQQEEDDIAKAIALSLKETKKSSKNQSSTISAAVASTDSNASSSNATYPSLYPTFGPAEASNFSNITNNTEIEPRKVRALYDFEAVEENELTFHSGEYIYVVDDSDQNWWKGYNKRGEGLFPSSFVTADLSIAPKRLDKNKKNVQFNDDSELQSEAVAVVPATVNQRIEIDEEKIDRLLHLLHEANPEDPSQDSEEMLRLEQEVIKMGPLIDAELERVDRKHAQLTQLSSDFVEAMNSYHSLLHNDRTGMAPVGYMAPGYPRNSQFIYGSGNGPVPSFPHAAGHFPNTQQMPYVGGPHSIPQQFPTNTGMPTAPNGPYNTADNHQMPLQFQNNDHMSSTQLMNGSGPMNGLPHQVPATSQQSTGLYSTFGNTLPQALTQLGQQQQSLQQQQEPNQPNYQMMPQHQQQLPPQVQPQQQQQQPQTQPQQFPNVSTASGALPSNDLQQNQQFMGVPPPTTATTSQPQQYLSPQHQLTQQTAYIPQQHPHPQPQQHPQSFPPTMPNVPQVFGGIPPLNNGGGGGNNGLDHYTHLHHQMAAMSIGLNQPQNFLVQNEPKTNIPIYQQQR